MTMPMPSGYPDHDQQPVGPAVHADVHDEDDHEFHGEAHPERAQRSRPTIRPIEVSPDAGRVTGSSYESMIGEIDEALLSWLGPPPQDGDHGN